MGVYIRALHYITLFESERRERRVGVTVLDIRKLDIASVSYGLL